MSEDDMPADWEWIDSYESWREAVAEMRRRHLDEQREEWGTEGTNSITTAKAAS